MVPYSTYIKKITYTCLIITLSIIVYLISIYICAVHQFVITYDVQFAAKIQQNISAYIRQYPIRAFSFKQLEQSLQKTFECIASIQGSIQPDGIIAVHVTIVEPLYILNNERILTANNTIIAADCYACDSIKKLPALSISLHDQQKQLPHQVFSYVATLCTFNLPNMAVFWKEHHDIHVNLCANSIKLRCNAYITPARELFDRCVQLAKEHSQSFMQARILADMRFDNQIIISKIKKLGEPL